MLRQYGEQSSASEFDASTTATQNRWMQISSDAMLRSGAACLTKPFEEERLLSALVRASATAV